MSDVVLVALAVAFAAMVFGFIARAVIIDFKEAAKTSGITRAKRIGMNPVQKEIQRSFVVRLATGFAPNTEANTPLERRLGKTA